LNEISGNIILNFPYVLDGSVHWMCKQLLDLSEWLSTGRTKGQLNLAIVRKPRSPDLFSVFSRQYALDRWQWNVNQ